MPNRRQVLVGAVGLPAALFAAHLLPAHTVDLLCTIGRAAPDATLRCALVDRRHADSREFGRALESQGVPTCGFEGDVSTVWRALLAAAALHGGGAVAGMTTPAALCCLERLAAGRALRVVWRELDAAADPDWRHGAADADRAPLLRWVIAAG